MSNSYFLSVVIRFPFHFPHAHCRSKADRRETINHAKSRGFSFLSLSLFFLFFFFFIRSSPRKLLMAYANGAAADPKTFYQAPGKSQYRNRGLKLAHRAVLYLTRLRIFTYRSDCVLKPPPFYSLLVELFLYSCLL